MNNETDSYIESLSRNQTFLLPKTIEEYVETDNPVRFIDAYVNTLDMEKLLHPLNPTRSWKTFLQSKRPLQTLPLWRPKPHPLKQKARKRMQNKPRMHLAAQRLNS
jgi:hypothetical protein